MRKCHLMDPAQTLIIGMRDHIKDQWMIDGNKPIHRIVDDFSYTWHSLLSVLLKLLLKRAAKCTKPEEIKNFY